MLAQVPKSQYFDQLTHIKDTTLSTSQLAQALPLRVQPEADGKLTANNFIDDIIACFIARNKQDTDHAVHALTTAFDTLARPTVAQGEPLPRDDMISRGKLKEEGTPTEELTVLGWVVHT